MSDLSNYEKLKSDSIKYYSSLGKIFCPVFNDYINFNSEGFNHILFKNNRSERDKDSQILRFKLLANAIKLISITTTFQEFEETLKEFQVKKFKKKALQIKPVRYWGLIAIIDNRKIKVILRKIGDNGQLHFWSVIPSWVTNKYRDIKFYTTMKGNPEED